MKRLLAFAVAAVVAISAASVYAGDGCCAAGKVKTDAKSAACGDMFSKLKLTDEQKAKIATLKEQTTRATSTSEARAMMSKGLEQILTPEQFAQCQSSCTKETKSGECPFMKSTHKSADSKS
jgi:Spy/CpxP family protein refolding chaperone